MSELILKNVLGKLLKSIVRRSFLWAHKPGYFLADLTELFLVLLLFVFCKQI